MLAWHRKVFLLTQEDGRVLVGKAAPCDSWELREYRISEPADGIPTLVRIPTLEAQLDFVQVTGVLERAYDPDEPLLVPGDELDRWLAQHRYRIGG